MKIFYRCIAALPLGLLYILSNCLYIVIFYVARYRRAVVKDNISQAFSDKSENEINQLVKSFYRFLCDNFIEVLKSLSMRDKELDRRVTFRNPEIFDRYIEQQQSMLLLTIHQSNWEWLLLALSVKLSFPIDVIYKPLSNRPLDELMRHSRESHGAKVIAHNTAAKEILKKRREFRGFVMAADQSPSANKKKYWQYFMNRAAAFHIGPQKIAEMLNYPVIYMKMHRLGRGYYEVSFEELSVPPYDQPPFDKDRYEILSRYIKTGEEAIKGQPFTYLWSNRKWRRNPETSVNNVNTPVQGPQDSPSPAPDV